MPLRNKVPAQAIREHLAYLAHEVAAHDGETGELFDEAGELDSAAVDAVTERGLSCSKGQSR